MATIGESIDDLKTYLGCEEAFEFTSRYLVGGLTSPGRRRPELDGYGFWVSRGEGPYLWDLKGHKYIDINCGHGGSQVGHGHPAIKKALLEAIEMGVLCGQETLLPAQVAQKICETVPGAELVRFSFTGTKATSLAVTLARGHTKRMKVIKFEGHYHGYNTALQFSMWPPPDQAGPHDNPTIKSENAGVIPEAANYIKILPWNDLEVLERYLKQEGTQVAAIIMEPVNYNSGTPPTPARLSSSRPGADPKIRHRADL